MSAVYFDDVDAEYFCEGCHQVADEEPQGCAECGMFLCRACWGPTVCDDLYVGWCNACAG